ncbi:MAG: hypothetical protein A3H96_14995 [Acidobacteria bacterium RIFCSPLOWO2_02_FULL_67_36]|nr:MAG: hypothetical protein A3H96_14995 [Acidobacteria bacterium RIFCSPLOWO2_02_FULL_67_36]OFW19289.1 MAG: hypothetical protein A3G21_02195 [Acidobacteria bacterium RIFCSPLOWO2_12_FULL_66_21]
MAAIAVRHMRHPETARAAVATLFVLAAALPAGRCTAVNSKTDSFATLAEARQAGAIAGGWVPDGLPPGSREIRAAHVPGTSARWGIVNFPPAEADALRAILEPAEVPLDGRRCNMPARIEWWPTEMRGTINGERLAATGIHGYRSRKGSLIFAVNWNQGRAYYWSE